MNSPLICPVCAAALSLQEKRAVCPAGHSFDRAKSGYYPLLLSQVPSHGDNAEMVAARRDFLSAGFYDPLVRAVAEKAAQYTPKDGVVLDAGAGEGYYTAAVERALPDDATLLAFDISKDAAARLAKRLSARAVSFVASAYRMPIADGAVDTALNLFAPLALEEYARVLKQGGHLLMAIPAEEHLFGLKAAVYDTPYKNTPDEPSLAGFELLSQEEIRFSLSLSDKAAIHSLFAMTPYAYRTSEEGRARLDALTTLSTDAHFKLFVYRKR